MNIGPTSPDHAKYMLKWFTIWKIYSKIYSTLCPISHHYITTFEVDGTASSIDNEYPNNFCHVHMIFTWSNKIAKFYSKDWISRSCHSNAFVEKKHLVNKKKMNRKKLKCPQMPACERLQFYFFLWTYHGFCPDTSRFVVISSLIKPEMKHVFHCMLQFPFVFFVLPFDY